MKLAARIPLQWRKILAHVGGFAGAVFVWLLASEYRTRAKWGSRTMWDSSLMRRKLEMQEQTACMVFYNALVCMKEPSHYPVCIRRIFRKTLDVYLELCSCLVVTSGFPPFATYPRPWEARQGVRGGIMLRTTVWVGYR